MKGWKEGWIDKAHSAIPPSKSTSLTASMDHAKYVLSMLPAFFCHSQEKNYRGLRIKRGIYSAKVLAKEARRFLDPDGGRVLVGFGDYGNQDGCIRGRAKGPVKKFKAALQRVCDVVMVDERLTSQVGGCCCCCCA
jgi:hypothetical protein